MIDPVTLQIFRNHAEAAADSMALALFRTAHSAFVRETEDFTSGLTTAAGETFAASRDLGATWFVGLDYGPVIRMIDSYRPGDVCITNDPYSGYVCTHTPDMHIWKPIFWDGRVVAFAVGHVHNTDVGGAVPASLSRQLVEVHQEGVRIPPSKIVSEGVLDESLLRIIATNVRMPEQNWGDLKAQLASVATGERRVIAMIERFGIETFEQATRDLLALGERRARAVIARIPDGEFRFADYLDEDSPGGHPVRLALTLCIAGDECTLDFTGSDPQLQSALNMPTGGAERHVLLMIGYAYCLYAIDPALPLNSGMLRPARCIVPSGTVLNATFPCAVGMRSMTCGRLQSVVIGAFQAALPQMIPAGPAGSAAILNLRAMDARSGRRVMASLNPVLGGAGGSSRGDGTDGSGAISSFLKNTPIEVSESEVPIRFHRYELLPDSGGAGQYRGGLAVELEFEALAPESTLTARNRDRTSFSPWGACGGAPGATSGFWRLRGDGVVDVLGNTDVVSIGLGERMRIRSAGGGGWGRPWMRESHRVVADVRQGKVTEAAAFAEYGVKIVDGELDRVATSGRRAEMALQQSVTLAKRYNEARDRFEGSWTEDCYRVLTELLSGVPVEWRHFVKSRIFEQIEQVRPEPGEPSDGRVRAAFQGAVARFPQLQGRLMVGAPADAGGDFKANQGQVEGGRT